MRTDSFNRKQLSQLIRHDFVSVREAMYIVVAYIMIRKGVNIELTINDSSGLYTTEVQQLVHACLIASTWLLQNGY